MHALPVPEDSLSEEKDCILISFVSPQELVLDLVPADTSLSDIVFPQGHSFNQVLLNVYCHARHIENTVMAR